MKIEDLKEMVKNCVYEEENLVCMSSEYYRKIIKNTERLNNIINGINNYCFKRMGELDDIRERDKKLEDFCENKINAFLEVREKIKELERSDKE